MNNFNLRLKERIDTINSNLCVGLDIRPEAFPGKVSFQDIKVHTRKIVDATADIAAAYKPNMAFFERWGSRGIEWLEEILEYIDAGPLLIGDAKRGDIGNTASQYARSLFDHFSFDAVTVNPYLGSDSIKPFLERPEKGVFLLCRTSNKSAAELQDLKINGETLYKKVAELAVTLNVNGNLGLVVGATVPEEIKIIRSVAPKLPFLIPGIGAQGGDLKKSMKYGNKNGIALINVSRAISFNGDLSENAIRGAAENYLKKMREYSDA